MNTDTKSTELTVSATQEHLSSASTRVVNVKVAFIRKLGYLDLNDWVADSSKNVYIGRKKIVFIKKANGEKERFPKQDSIWANPYKLNSAGTNRDEVLLNFEIYMRDLIIRKSLQPQLALLKGKNLGCWCHPEPCHGDVLARLICFFCP